VSSWQPALGAMATHKLKSSNAGERIMGSLGLSSTSPG
jgi:hypothetical protein